ncbi:MAG: hypothetical protein ACT4QD_21645, partial [Acidobacteriota bacterium]
MGVSIWQRAREWILRLAGSVRPGRTDADLAAELQSHLDLAADAARASAAPPGADAARGGPRGRAGGVMQAQESL